MSIIINDLDNSLIDFCDLELDYCNLMCINKHYNNLISNNQLFNQWKVIGNTRNRNKLFIKCCKNGFLSFAKYLVFKHTINIHAYREAAFRYSCENGNLDVAKWLIELSRQPNYKLIDIHINNDSVFFWTCVEDHFDVATWLIELSNQPNFTPINDEIIAKHYHPK